MRVAVTDLAGGVITETVTDLDVDHRPESVTGIGIAVSAPVSPATHVVNSDVILPDWRRVDLVGEVARRTGLPVEIGNDANLGAVAEHRYGAARSVDDFVYVMVSDGVGAGLVLDGRLYEGAVGAAGELGHVTVDPGGFVCRCGNRGCLETVAGARALSAALTLTHGHDNTLAAILASDHDGDERAQRVMIDAGSAVGRAVIPLCTVLDLALVVIGGDCAVSPTFVDAVRRTVDASTTPLRRQPVPVVAGALGERAEMLGAVALATQRTTLA